jgi:hypothetical protein
MNNKIKQEVETLIEEYKKTHADVIVADPEGSTGIYFQKRQGCMWIQRLYGGFTAITHKQFLDICRRAEQEGVPLVVE